MPYFISMAYLFYLRLPVMKAHCLQTMILFLLILSSCKITEQNIVGTYRLKKAPKTKLVLKADKTFEFVKNLPKPGIEVFPDSTDLNFRTTGSWQLDNKVQLVLNSFPYKSLGRTWDRSTTIKKETSITSLSFWDFYDDPAPIRFIKFPNDRIKFRLGNSISFFAGDFNKGDTLEFHFYGYRPYIWPDMADNNENNNQYKIILNEQNRQGFFKDVIFIVKRKKIVSTLSRFTLIKTK
jgi:hypothetical protein